MEDINKLYEEFKALPASVKAQKSEHGVSIAWLALLARRSAKK